MSLILLPYRLKMCSLYYVLTVILWPWFMWMFELTRRSPSTFINYPFSPYTWVTLEIYWLTIGISVCWMIVHMFFNSWWYVCMSDCSSWSSLCFIHLYVLKMTMLYYTYVVICCSSTTICYYVLLTIYVYILILLLQQMCECFPVVIPCYDLILIDL